VTTLCMAGDKHRSRAAPRAAHGITSAAARPDALSQTATVQPQCGRGRPLAKVGLHQIGLEHGRG